MYTGGERVETYRITKDSATNEVVLEFLHATTIDPMLNGITNDLIFINERRFIMSDW
jgi:hypothetical protein